MGKFQDRYFKTAPWSVTEEGFDPAYCEVAESVFSLGNEFMGLRGYADEEYSGDSLQGFYVNGIYETRGTVGSAYKGIIDKSDFMVNTVDCIYTRISVNGINLDISACDITDFRRELDLRTGVLTRSFVWNIDANTSVEFTFERFLSMPRCNFGGQRIVWKIISGKANAAICAGLDFSRLHQMSRTNYWNTENAYAEGNCVSIKGMTKTSGQTLYASAVFSAYGKGNADDAKKPFIEYEFEGGGSLERVFMVSKTDEAIPRDVAYDMLKEESAQWWRRQWETSDIVIEGDDAQQQGIRFGIFQMHQTMHTGGHSAVFGAKGLTGEAYNGNTFWDTEVYCLPFYLYNNPEAAKTIMRFRYDTLGRAKERAAMLDCQGAFYPIATISGRECCDMWQHASLQLQASTAVAYAIQKYTQITGDDSFLKECGMEILVEVCRMLASRGAFDPVTGEYGFYGVMGPDEFQVMVNHNAYTNFVAKKTLEYTVDTLRQTKTNPIFAPTDEEIADWTNKASRMKILYDDETKLFEQHEGYYHLPHVDVASIPVTDFPLYSHWSYDRIYRNDMLKQPDVLMFMLMYAEEFTSEQFKANYDFYEPRCIHESSLSPSVHSIIAAKLGLTDEAYRFFEFGSRMDLDNYNRNTREGLHSTSIAGSWMNIVYGFGGLTVRDGVPAFTTSLPSAWKSLSFNVLFRGRLINVNIAHGESRLKLCRGEPIAVELNGKMVSLS